MPKKVSELTIDIKYKNDIKSMKLLNKFKDKISWKKY